MAVNPKDRPSEERINDFDEVNLGYTDEEAVKEAQRCKECGVCIKGCPVRINIPAFISQIKKKNFKRALSIIEKDNILPGICGRVCPQENQCEARCIMDNPINIGALERFLADKKVPKDIGIYPSKNNKKIAIVGSGPAGLTSAFELKKSGFEVVVYEALHKLGGVLRYGIPNFRLPDEIIDEEIEQLKKMGVQFRTNFLIGKTLYLDELLDKFDGIVIATGAGLPRYLKIPGENSIGVFFANEFLTRINLMKAYKFPEYHTPIYKGKKVVVIGGGNVAIDAARVARRLKSEVMICYRRLEEDMPARNEEIQHAKEEGIEIKTLLNPKKIISKDDGKIKKVKFVKMKTVGKQQDGRNAVVETEEYIDIETDIFIEAIGQIPNKIIQQNSKGLEFDSWNSLKIDENMETTKNNVWAAGDVVSGAATVIKAMGEAKKAAEKIIKEIGG
ncbi:MAG: NADPH-dependent glutamate synthase [Candidatus Mcinerneyibacterium aminivorans]|uniref:NADPH-dependent glutamate synthase n=1 Tax=Candidatus Mcinerneyibacterium aminivorans TaxID=2703815 RepID=A0A5D0MBE7_9BACT|nr:MAG: NADPH-dependent glutamate synthase [Candidatus Mcinerneyibacterium aminivorans]